MTSETTNGNGNGDQRISFTVKELLARIEGKIDLISSTVALKADTSVVEHLALRIAEYDRRSVMGERLVEEFRQSQKDIAELKSSATEQAAILKYRRWLFSGGTLVAVVAAANLGISLGRFFHLL